VKGKLKTLLKETVSECFEEGLLQETPLPDFVIEVPSDPKHGHFATNLALTLASSQRRAPREIGKIIASCLKGHENFLERTEVAGPGFINFTISSQAWHEVLSSIVRLRDGYGKSDMGNGEKMVVEFVSANPTGPLHLGHGRGAAVGDTLCRVFSFCGYEVVREFYVNDAGQQIRLLGESIFSRVKQMTDPGHPFPESGYQGDYVLDLARAISQENDLGAMPAEEAIMLCARRGKEIMLAEIKQVLSQFGVTFDVWSMESDLYSSGSLQKALDSLMERGELYENDEALWIRTTDFGDDKDRVIRKKDGQFTYFASDISYHLEKRRRGFSRAINIWGADHHGYVPRVKAALMANGFAENWLSVLLIQLVKLWKKGQEIKMSKRAGNFVTLQELIEEVGVDAVRFVFLTKHHDTTLDFNIDLVKEQNSDNPVYYVQYAHARLCSVFRKAAEEGIFLPEEPDGLLDLLQLEEELTLIRILSEFPSLLEDISRNLEPHRLTYYLTELAASFHRYFNLGTKIPECRIVTVDRSLSQARLFLAEAVRIVIANGLRLLGTSAPERM